jgi:hypothetical protein
MFAMAERRHPVVMLERPLVETKYTVNDNPTWELTSSVLPSLRSAADPPVGLVRRREAGSEHYRQSRPRPC